MDQPTLKYPDGVSVIIGGISYVAPKLNLKGVRAILPMIDTTNMRLDGKLQLTTGALQNAVDIGIVVLVASLVRNYPIFTKAFVEENVEADELLELLNVTVPAILKLSGFENKVEVKSGEDRSPPRYP